MRAIVGAILIILTIASDVEAARRWFHWPWESAYRRRHYHHKPRPKIEGERDRPDCPQINEAIAALPPEKLARALRRSNKKQLATIEECARRAAESRE